jgi:hypothetical protein
MKTKIGVYLTRDLARRLKVVMRRHGATKSDLVNEALRQFFDPAPVRDPGDEILLQTRAGQFSSMGASNRIAPISAQSFLSTTRLCRSLTTLHEQTLCARRLGGSQFLCSA